MLLLLIVQGAAYLGAQRIFLESDCQTMVSVLKGRDYAAAELGVLFREARSLCHASFESYDFKYCKHDCNMVAHALAQFGLSADAPFSVWAVDAPDFFRSW
ncbi:hypothetical protein VPH35_040982 [Triticum aestivum]|uniref:RNase H type-1 domain-containing protein n=1 Tax=Aegilops tauschii subsp. strangulata TaxID=200361 RepID=A0A453DEL3_AEGTS